MTWKPRPRAGAVALNLPLDARQGYLLSRLDGTLDLPTLAALMNLENRDLADLLDQLVALGAVDPEFPGGPPSPEPAVPPEPEEDLPQSAAKAATHRSLFERQLHPQSVDQRTALAGVAVEPELSALCFDPTAEVIRALLENPRVGGVHARLIATHHRTTAGLEALGARTPFTNDAGVRRALLQNPLLPPGLFRRLWAPKRLLEQYLVATSREAPEQTRAMARDLLRASFNQRTGEERAELILTTEGRCLASLVGLTVDGHTTALLCRRTYTSTLLIQNIARWSAAPPQLIAHLRRQDVVKRNQPLRQLLERHPNAS
ncbi:MAG TPA: hypothetical protein VJ463_06195 [Geothrix sp.]|nr:hypothetical protein [Geothrix sp.]